jgi:hypothetical protein
MSLISKIGKLAGEKLLGTVIADYGTLPTNSHGWTVSITLRAKKDKTPHLVFKWKNGNSTAWESLEATPQTIDRLQTILCDVRTHVESAGSLLDVCEHSEAPKVSLSALNRVLSERGRRSGGRK